MINLEIKALQNLKNINKSFNEAVIQISKCQSKIILCGVGKSGLIASKIALLLLLLEHLLLVFLQVSLSWRFRYDFKKRYFDSN